jgi:hypothetical protein
MTGGDRERERAGEGERARQAGMHGRTPAVAVTSTDALLYLAAVRRIPAATRDAARRLPRRLRSPRRHRPARQFKARLGKGRGVDVALDMLGGPAVQRNLSLMAPRGRHVSVAFLQGLRAEACPLAPSPTPPPSPPTQSQPGTDPTVSAACSCMIQTNRLQPQWMVHWRTRRLGRIWLPVSPPTTCPTPTKATHVTALQ